jgi:hypothetical protein
MIAGRLGRQAVRGVVFQHCLQQFDTRRLEVLDDVGKRLSWPLGERGLKIGERGDAGPGCLVRSS